MINDTDLNKILKEYNLQFTKKRRENLKEYGQESELKEILSYLIDYLKVSPANIEKCPSILYSKIKNIKSNYEFLTDKGIYNYNIETCLHILETNHNDLKNTYEYVHENYGSEFINKNTSILKTSVERIKSIELRFKNYLDKEAILAAATSRHDVDEISNIILACKNKIKITPSVFKQNSQEVEKIISFCNNNGIAITGSVFHKKQKELIEMKRICDEAGIQITNSMFACPMKNFEELICNYTENNTDIHSKIFRTNQANIEKIFEICNEYGIDVNLSMLNCNSEEVEKIIEICNKKHVKLSGTMFNKSASEVEKIIDYLQEKNIEDIGGSYFKKNKDELAEIMELCEKNNLKREGTIFGRTPKEIKEIIDYCKNNNIKLEYSMFNHNLEEIQEIVEMCKKKHVPVSGGVFNGTSKRIDRTVTILKRKGIPFTPVALLRSPKEIEKIIKYVGDPSKVSPNMFNRTPYEVKEIIRICNEHSIPLTGSFFQKPLEDFKEIVDFCYDSDNNIKLTAGMLFRKKAEIEDIIRICNREGIEIVDSIYKRTPDEIEDIIDKCKNKYNIEITAGCFRKAPVAFKEVVERCIKNEIPAKGEVFKRTPDEIDEITKVYKEYLSKKPDNNAFGKAPDEVKNIIQLLQENDIEITGTVYRKKSKELEETINFIKANYGKEYLLPQIIIYDKEQIHRIFSYLRGRGLLEYVKISPAILKLELAEIIDRDAYIHSRGEGFIENGKFNSVFGWSRKKYKEMKDKKIDETSKGM